MNNLTHSIKDVGIIVNVKAEGECSDAMKSRSYTVPTELVTHEDGTYYVALSRKHSSVRRFMTCQARKHIDTSHADEGMTTSNFDVPDQLKSVLVKGIKMFVAGDAEAAKALPKRWARNKRYQTRLMELPNVMSIRTPKIGNIPEIDINVLGRLKGPVHIEMTDASITWLTKAVAHQVDDGDFHSKWKGDGNSTAKKQRVSDEDNCEDDDDLESDKKSEPGSDGDHSGHSEDVHHVDAADVPAADTVSVPPSSEVPAAPKNNTKEVVQTSIKSFFSAKR